MASNDAQTQVDARPRRRTAEDGRIVTNVGELFGGYICEQAADLGISPATVARMLIVEAVTKHRGISKEDLEAKYGTETPKVA